MKNRDYFNFLLLLLTAYRSKHTAVFFISTILIFVMASTLFIASSIQKDIDTTLKQQGDFVVQRYKAGKVLNTPMEWVDEFSEINGVTQAQGRVYGMHYYEPLEQYFMIVGVDFFDANVVASLQELVNTIDVKSFLSKKQMIIGAGVKAFLDEYHYFDYYIFRPPDRSMEKVYIYDNFSDESGIVTNDMIIMDINLARTILGVEEGYVTDIVLKVPNELERETLKRKLITSHFNMRIIQKEEIARYYENLFNYKGGLFLLLYMMVLLTFLLILYQRYSMITHSDAKEVAILRSVGWQINEVIALKMGENFIVALSAYLVGVSVAYFYVFVLNAPLLKNIFLGSQNLNLHVNFVPVVDVGMLGLIFLMFVIPFMIAILIPVYRAAILDPVEVMR
jgi:ABC-type lipoprotein release transport system permease subunit